MTNAFLKKIHCSKVFLLSALFFLCTQREYIKRSNISTQIYLYSAPQLYLISVKMFMVLNCTQIYQRSSSDRYFLIPNQQRRQMITSRMSYSEKVIRQQTFKAKKFTRKDLLNQDCKTKGRGETKLVFFWNAYCCSIEKRNRCEFCTFLEKKHFY